MLIHGDALSELRKMPEATFDCILTDPPYGSGGNTLSAIQSSLNNKYFGEYARAMGMDCPEFLGDQQTPFAYQEWYLTWLNDAYRVTKIGGSLLLFCDWRSLPAVVNWPQWAGYLYKGVIVWDKQLSRPLLHRFRHQAEYIAYFTKGRFEPNPDIGTLPGIYKYTAPSLKRRIAMTEKPVGLLCDLLKICKPGAKVLDPFMGSGSVIEACIRCGLEPVGIEKSSSYFQIATERINSLNL